MRKYEKASKGEMASVMKKIIEYMKGSVGIVAVALVLAALGAVLTIIGPDKVGEITDLIADGLMTGIDLKAVARVGIFLGAIYISSSLFTFIQQYIMATVTLKMSYRMRSDLSRKINCVPQKYFNSHSQGDILSRITNDVSTLQQGLTNSLPTIISAAAQFVGCLIMMFVTEWRLALISLFITFLGLFLIVFIMSKSQKFFLDRQESLGKLNGYVEEMYSGHEVVRISRGADNVKKHFAGLNEAVYNANWKSQFLSGIMQPLMNVIGNLAYVAVCVFGSMLALNGTITFGVIISFILYVRLFTSPLGQIAQGMTNMQTASASAQRIFDFIESEELSDESDKSSEMPEVKGNVSFENVRFSYPDTPDKVIIKNFSAEVKAGQKVAIVGPTGAGKTTMVNLLMRFFEINSGSISIDGTPISQLSRETVHNMFSMVLQDTWLFKGSIEDNIRYGKLDATHEEVVAAANAAYVHRFVQTLPNGYNMELNEEASNVSQGQKQLLTIARAILADPPIMILDEATSSVDTRTEVRIQKAMDNLMKGRTSFIIAHRLSTIRDADLILVMKDGDIIEQGNHEELLQKKGFYAELYNSQFERSA